MSAFVVGHDHIDALLTFAVDLKIAFYNPENKRTEYINDTTVTDIGKILLAENERSVGHRYGETDPDDMPGTTGEDSRNYKFRRFGANLTCLSILKACDCFDYQACETEDYEASLACRIVNCIRGYAVRRLPGFDDAPGWEFRRKPLSAVA